MGDYRRLFGEEVALGLGLGQPPQPRETIADYEADPAEAFSRMAESFQTPGGAVPVPFANEPINGPSPHSRNRGPSQPSHT